MQNSASRYFIVGTDTGVGKTILSLIMMRFFYDRGLNPFYLKPFQTGCEDPYDDDSDSKFIYGNVGPLKGKDPSESNIFCFKNPKAPIFAARDEGREREIDMDVVKYFVEEKGRHFNPIIIEGAGGLLVPVTERTLMIDLIEITEAQPIVAAQAGLGTINHTLLTLEALKARGIPPIGIVFLDSGEFPVSVNMIRENMEAIERYSHMKVAGVIHAVGDFSCPHPDCFVPIERMNLVD